MDDQQLNEIKVRRLGITLGDWKWRNAIGYTVSVFSVDEDGEYLTHVCSLPELSQNDAAFIAHAPADIDALVAEVEAPAPKPAENPPGHTRI